VSAVDTAGNEGAQSSPLSAIPRDATPPGQLVGLRVTYEGHQRVDLAWDANAEADLAGYIILADGAEVARTGSLTRSVTGLVNGQTYTLAVRAYDTSQNEGPPASVQARPRDDLPPAAPTGFTLEAHDRRVILRWTPPADADLAGVRVYRDGAHVRNVPVGTNEWTDTSVLNLVAYTYQLKAYDYAGNTGTGPTGSATPVDDAAPAQPVWDYTHGWDGKVELRWRPLADVVTYRILRDGIAIAQGLDANAYYDTTVVNGVTYAYRVQAIDAAGNAGPPSEPVTLGGIAPLSYDENVRELREGPVRMYAENLPWIAAVALIGIILCCIVGTAAFRK
jgi:hypothetical protein